jgi:hypothetical protein
MSLSLILLVKIIPLYVLIGIGYLSNKFLHVTKEGVARMLIYVFSPAVVFLGTTQAKGDNELFLIPIIFFVIGTLLCLITYFIASKIWHDGTEKIASFASGTGNTGYFGLPVCLALVGDDALKIVAMVSIGLILFENTVGFYIVARASHSTKEALKKLLRLPSLYAFAIGIILNLLNITPTVDVINFFNILKGGYVPLGMMMIGLGLAEITMSHLDWKFTSLVFFNKFIVWPGIFLALIYLDKTQLHIFNTTVYSVLLIESLVPVAANCVSYATELKAQPQKIALVVALSTLIALFYIPAATALLI